MLTVKDEVDCGGEIATTLTSLGTNRLRAKSSRYFPRKGGTSSSVAFFTSSALKSDFLRLAKRPLEGIVNVISLSCGTGSLYTGSK